MVFLEFKTVRAIKFGHVWLFSLKFAFCSVDPFPHHVSLILYQTMSTWALLVVNISECAASVLLIQVYRIGLYFDIQRHILLFLLTVNFLCIFPGDSDIIKSVPGDHWFCFQAVECLVSLIPFFVFLELGFNREHCVIVSKNYLSGTCMLLS